MAVDEGESERLDLRLLIHSSATLYFRHAKLQEDIVELVRLGYDVERFQCGEWHTQAHLHDAFSAQLQFPDYYGRSLDALNDCLRDLAFPDGGGRAIAFERYDLFA